MDEVIIEKVEEAETKSMIVEEVLKDLPDWFGLPEKDTNIFRLKQLMKATMKNTTKQWVSIKLWDLKS